MTYFAFCQYSWRKFPPNSCVLCIIPSQKLAGQLLFDPKDPKDAGDMFVLNVFTFGGLDVRILHRINFFTES
jgi:hypothetical protein